MQVVSFIPPPKLDFGLQRAHLKIQMGREMAGEGGDRADDTYAKLGTVRDPWETHISDVDLTSPYGRWQFLIYIMEIYITGSPSWCCGVFLMTNMLGDADLEQHLLQEIFCTQMNTLNYPNLSAQNSVFLAFAPSPTFRGVPH